MLACGVCRQLFPRPDGGREDKDYSVNDPKVADAKDFDLYRMRFGEKLSAS